MLIKFKENVENVARILLVTKLLQIPRVQEQNLLRSYPVQPATLFSLTYKMTIKI